VFFKYFVKRAAFFEDKNDHSLIYSAKALTHVQAPPQVFIPGKNWRLSLAELASFLKARKAELEVCSFSKEFFVVNIEENSGAWSIADLGGFIKIGAATANLSNEIVKKAFIQKNKETQAQISCTIAHSHLIGDMLKARAEKTVFGVSVYCAESALRPFTRIIQRFVGSSVKRELAKNGKKAKFMGFSKERKYPQLSHIEVLKKNLVENKAEILFCIGRDQTWISTTTAVHNPFEFQKRDVGKPNQRKIFAMPPRLARIMVNLASCTSGKLLLDPFCGVGTILQEALLAKARALGVDINPWCVKAAGENLEWLKREYGLTEAEYRVLQGDTRTLTQKIGWEEVDCVATEPDLGPALRHVATTPYAIKIIEKLEPLYHSFMEEAYKVLKTDGKLVLVTPYIQTRSGQPVTMCIGEKAANIGFTRVYPFPKAIFAESGVAQENLVKMTSLADAEERHKIGREIHIFQK
jgi:tRNA G10  N-methylase Trm11